MAMCHHQPEQQETTQVGDLPEACLALAIARTSPRDAARCAAVSRAFRAAADSDHVWDRFIPRDLLPPAAKSSKAAYLGLCDGAAAGALLDDGGGLMRVWLAKATGARCYALSARRLSLPWDDGEFAWKWTPHPLSRFADVAELVHCTSLDIYARLPAAALTPATPYAAHLVYGTAAEGGHRGLSFPDQETAVAVAGRVVARHSVCLRPDEAETRKFRRVAAAAAAGGVVVSGEPAGPPPRTPRLREDGWWEMEMGRVTVAGGEREEDVVASFEVLGWYPKRGLIVEAVEFRPISIR